MTCGAKTKSGKPCRARQMENGRCRIHGGKSPGAPPRENHGKSTFNIYSKYYTDDDIAIAANSPIGSIDHEITLVRIRIARTLKAEQAAKMLLVEETSEYSSEGENALKVRQIKRLPDFESILDRWVGRLGSLERVRKEIGGDGSTPLDKAKELFQAIKAMKEVEGGN